MVLRCEKMFTSPAGTEQQRGHVGFREPYSLLVNLAQGKPPWLPRTVGVTENLQGCTLKKPSEEIGNTFGQALIGPRWLEGPSR